MASNQEMSVIQEASAPGELNERCPLQTQCEQHCGYLGHEADCPYYAENASGDYVIEDQEEWRKTRARAEAENVFPAEETDSGNTDAVSLPVEMISVEYLAPHPDNPRKDLGDLTELADNIRANGVLQNLTVVPDESAFDAPRFLVIIGHRRLAAAKLAGLTELPCVIAERMTPAEQVAVMLSENIQRESLTRYEEAKGFEQLQIDFGYTVSDIAKVAGFHETTVRRRLKLLELDADKFKAAETRGATLSDYMELDKIESPELKNEVLDKIGTPDFKNALKSALDDEKNRKVIERWAAEAGAFATRVEEIDFSTVKYVRNYSIYGSKKDSVERPADAGETAYYFKIDRNSLTLYRVKGDTEQEEEAAAEARREAMREASQAREAKLTEMTKRHFELRKEFISSVSLKNADFPKVMRYASDILIGDGRYHSGADMELLAEILELDALDENEDFETVKKRFLADFNDTTVTREARLMLCASYARADSDRNGYWVRRWDSADGGERHERAANPDLDALYELLTALGYEMSKEERRMRDGTHELLQPLQAAESAENSDADT